MKVRPITELSCVTSISTVTPALDHRQQCPFLFSPTELFGRERRIRRPPAGMKWGGRGWNIFACFFLVGQVEFYSRCVIVEGSGTGIKYIVTLKLVPEVINFSIILVVVSILSLVVVVILRFCVAAAPPPPC